ncbi:cytochrome c550 [Alteribacillus persepolensis]|uniref:Cytochrome c550 n=1 Tax=Alteribacillus persepolensis TaxID=568899 RepID=A0A1G8CSX3_9BACI|nr:cytochrome c [Alteribacillus persepolensis]SDH48373.1 cytochrome c550 [Alteribacillus persepolensis]
MKNKPLIPFLITAVAGLLLMLGLSLVGVNQQQAGEDGEDAEQQDPVEYGEELVNENCISCHGENLEGQGDYPAINDSGEQYSAEELADIAQNGIGDMPGGIANPEESQAIAEYLMSLSEE